VRKNGEKRAQSKEKRDCLSKKVQSKRNGFVSLCSFGQEMSSFLKFSGDILFVIARDCERSEAGPKQSKTGLLRRASPSSQ